MKKLLQKKWVKGILIIIILIIAYLIWNLFYLYEIRLQDKYKTQFLNSVLSYDEEIININDITPFEWDIAYVYFGNMDEAVFDDYTRYSLKDEVSFEPKISDKFTFIIFVKNNKKVLLLRAESFGITSNEMINDKIEIFHFVPQKSDFSVSVDKYDRMILTYLE